MHAVTIAAWAKHPVFSAGVETIQAGATQAFVTIYDFTPHHRLLDVGGGTGSWSAAVARQHRHMAATVVARGGRLGASTYRRTGSE